jgi:predicted dehydrogenase
MTRLKWGILGTGKIAGVFAGGVAVSETGRLVAVGSRAQEAANRFAGAFASVTAHPSYDALIADPEVDAVYISLPNHLHAEWTIKCARMGKHILCEKPFTVNHAEAVAALEIVHAHDVFFMEAFMYRCHPQTQRLKQLLEDHAIGDVRLIQTNFSYNMGPKYENIRLSNPAAGGGIMDVGCYTASMARLAAGAEPEIVTGAGYIGPISRVDEQATASLLFPSGAVANLACGTQVAADSELRIWGSDGNIRVPNPWFPGEKDNKILLQKPGQPVEEILVTAPTPLYAVEADTVARYIEARQAPLPCMTWEDTLGNMAVLDAWRAAIGLVFDVEKEDSGLNSLVDPQA